MYSRVIDLEDPKDTAEGAASEPLHDLPELGMKIPWGPIGESVYRRTYAFLKNGQTIREIQVRNEGLPEDQREALPAEEWETWPETVRRVVRGNLGLVRPDQVEPDEEEKLVRLMMPFGIMPGGRHLAASGLPGRQFLYNCHSAGWDYSDPAAHFTFMFDQLMQGGGVGSNYSNRYLHLMPAVKSKVEVFITCREDHPDFHEFSERVITPEQAAGLALGGATIHEVGDSREGWVEAGRVLFDAAWFGKLETEILVFDVSKIRRKGAILVTSGGKAAGPKPLIDLLEGAAEVLFRCAGRRLTSLEAMELDHAIAACVVAGGKRRSSRMSVKSWKDSDILDFIHCKLIDGKHWTTNISVEIDDTYTAALADEDHHLHGWAYLVHHETVVSMRSNGEPGFWNRSLAAQGERDPELMFCPNPCGEIGLYMWENCNLGHVNLEFFAQRPLSQTKEAFRLMTRFLMRATFGDIPNPRQRKVVDENRRIGVGFMGFHSWLMFHGIKYSEAYKSDFVAKRLCTFKEVIDNEKVVYASVLGIPVPCKGSALAPNGTGALLPGCPSSMQAMFAGWGIRRMRCSDTDSELARLKSLGYPTYRDPQAKNTQIVDFWYEDPLVAKLRAAGIDPDTIVEGQDEIPFESSLALQALVQKCYADNAISFTINVPNDKRPDLPTMKKLFAEYLPHLKGTTYFPDVSRAFPPFERKTKAEFDAYTGPKEVTTVEQECLNGACPVK